MIKLKYAIRYLLEHRQDKQDNKEPRRSGTGSAMYVVHSTLHCIEKDNVERDIICIFRLV